MLDGPGCVGLDTAQRKEMHGFDAEFRVGRLVGRQFGDKVVRLIGQEQFGHIHGALLQHLQRRADTAGNGEQVKETVWFRVSAWGKTAEVCNQYLKKGSKVLVEGRLTPDKTTGGPRIFTRGDGSAGSSFEVTAATVRFLSSRGEADSGPMAGGGGMDMVEMPPEDDIPF